MSLKTKLILGAGILAAIGTARIGSDVFSPVGTVYVYSSNSVKVFQPCKGWHVYTESL